jgi:hypothetical protein
MNSFAKADGCGAELSSFVREESDVQSPCGKEKPAQDRVSEWEVAESKAE